MVFCRYAEDVEWLIHFDVDEFLLPHQDFGGDVRRVLETYSGKEGPDVLSLPMDYYG